MVKTRYIWARKIRAQNIFTGSSGKYVDLAETIRGFQSILSGELDGLPEQAFYLVGNIDEVTTKAVNLEMESNLKK